MHWHGSPALTFTIDLDLEKKIATGPHTKQSPDDEVDCADKLEVGLVRNGDFPLYDHVARDVDVHEGHRLWS